MNLRSQLPFVPSLLAIAACGTPVLPRPASPPTAPPNTTSASTAILHARVAPSEAYVDEAEQVEPIAMSPLFDSSAPPSSFPKATVGDIGCLGQATLTGDHARDYDAIVAACGAPTGLREYVRPAAGKLHYARDQRDSYAIRLLGGYCYRFFAVSDATIFNLNLRVRTPGGARTVEDRTSSPVAVIESDAPWCVSPENAGDYRVELEVEGPGFGGYEFGVWARPKP